MRLDCDFDFEFSLSFISLQKAMKGVLVMGAFGKGTICEFDTIPI